MKRAIVPISTSFAAARRISRSKRSDMRRQMRSLRHCARNGASQQAFIEVFLMLRVLNETNPPSPALQTAVASVGLADIVSAETQAIVQAWKKWRGWHAMPNSSVL